MQLITKLDKGFRFLLWFIDICSKYAWVIFLKDKKGITITVFQKLLEESKCKPKKINSEFYNKSMKSWLEKKCYRNVFNA